MTQDPGTDRDARLRAEFRAYVREHHPDRGGDPDEFVAGMARFTAARAEAADTSRYDAPIEFVTPHPLPLRLAIALIRTVRKHRNNRVQ